MIEQQAKEIRYFFFSQAFTDGFRITFAILFPSLLGNYFDMLDIGMTISLGALCVSFADAPGPIKHKRNAMIFCAGFIFIVAMVTSLARMNTYLLGIEIIVISFLFSMITVYGNRAASVGNAVMLVMILTMDKPVAVYQVVFHSLLIFIGGIFYLLISILFYNLQPYRAAQRILGDSIREVAAYLSIKADFYNPATQLEEDYKNLVAKQILVNEKQDAVREILFKTRQIVNESTAQGRKLVWAFVETVDLFEDVTASYYDYSSLRNKYKDTGILEKISSFIKVISIELDKTGVAIQMNISYRSSIDFESQLKSLKEQIDAVTKTGTESNLVLKKILVNLRRLIIRHNELQTYFDKQPIKKRNSSVDHSHFVAHQTLDPKIFWDNINPGSSVFRHAIRVSIGCIVGYIIVNTIAYGNYSYWILLTIAFILKPEFSLTKSRNIQRFFGTLIGGAIGVAILIFIPNKTAQFIFLVLFMIGNYSFMRINYLVMVICVTPFVLILFNFLGVGFIELATERILDTVIGCAIAFSAGYFLFPKWESEQLKVYLTNILKANAAYLEKIIEGLSGKRISELDYKLVRKEVYVSSANLAAAFQRMLSEPKSKQTHSKKVHQFVVLNHILFSNMATIATTLVRKEPRLHPLHVIAAAKNSLSHLNAVFNKLDGTETNTNNTISFPQSLIAETETISADDLLLKNQLDFIGRTVKDIEKVTATIV